MNRDINCVGFGLTLGFGIDAAIVGRPVWVLLGYAIMGALQVRLWMKLRYLDWVAKELRKR